MFASTIKRVYIFTVASAPNETGSVVMRKFRSFWEQYTVQKRFFNSENVKTKKFHLWLYCGAGAAFFAMGTTLRRGSEQR